MLFAEKLKFLRKDNKMTQTELAEILGVSLRTMQNYESGKSYPKQTHLYAKMSEIFGVTTDYLLSDEDMYIIDAEERGGRRARKDVQALITELGGLFAGGELSEEDKEKVMRAVNDLYWKAKDNNRKYSHVPGEDDEQSVKDFDDGE